MKTLVLSGLLCWPCWCWRFSRAETRSKKQLPYDLQELQETIFTPAERSFLGVLDLAVGDKARVLVKVRVADVLIPQVRFGKSKWQQHFNKISGKHFDYLLCHPTDLLFIYAIELDDSSHRHQKRKARALFLKTACDSAGLQLLQIPASSGYQVEELREQIPPLLLKTSEPVVDDLLPGQRLEPTFNPLLLEGGTSVLAAMRHWWSVKPRKAQCRPPFSGLQPLPRVPLRDPVPPYPSLNCCI